MTERIDEQFTPSRNSARKIRKTARKIYKGDSKKSEKSEKSESEKNKEKDGEIEGKVEGNIIEDVKNEGREGVEEIGEKIGSEEGGVEEIGEKIGSEEGGVEEINGKRIGSEEEGEEVPTFTQVPISFEPAVKSEPIEFLGEEKEIGEGEKGETLAQFLAKSSRPRSSVKKQLETPSESSIKISTEKFPRRKARSVLIEKEKIKEKRKEIIIKKQEIKRKEKKISCCICMDQNVPSNIMSGCLHPVCVECVKQLQKLDCPNCRKPLSQIYDLTETSIKSKQTIDQKEKEYEEKMKAQELEPVDELSSDEELREFNEPFYNNSSYPQSIQNKPFFLTYSQDITPSFSSYNL